MLDTTVSGAVSPGLAVDNLVKMRVSYAQSMAFDRSGIITTLRKRPATEMPAAETAPIWAPQEGRHFYPSQGDTNDNHR
jgi:hypothetical protein